MAAYAMRGTINTRDKLLVYFTVNPDEELSLRDIANKYNVSPKSVSEITTKMRHDGLLMSRVDKRSVIVFIGPALRAMQ
jgi:DNA-binding IscR family transcriptional regulator